MANKADSRARMKNCPDCGALVDLLTIGYRKTLGSFVVREHQCPGCRSVLMSVQMLVSPTQLLELGISPLIGSERTRRRRVSRVGSAGAGAGSRGRATADATAS